MEAIQDMSKSEMASQLTRAKATLRKFRDTNEGIIARVSSGAMAMGGAATAAVLDAKMPDLPGTNFPTKVLVGGLAAAIGIAEGAGKMSEQLASFGFGCLATQVYDTTKKALAA